MSKSHCDDDVDDVDCISNDDGNANGNSAFVKWCFHKKGGDEADDYHEQNRSVATDLAECNGKFENVNEHGSK